MTHRSHVTLAIGALVLALAQLFHNLQIVAGQQANKSHHLRCSKQSITLARQLLDFELDKLNDHLPLWFNELDKDELVEEQKQSLSSIVMSGSGGKLLNSNGQPLIEIEASYFRLFNSLNNAPHSETSSGSNNRKAWTNLKLSPSYQEKCTLNTDKHYYSYAFGLSIGPFEHHLDVLYNLPKDLRLSQPIDWRYAQVTLVVPRMNYEILLKQSINLPELGRNNVHSKNTVENKLRIISNEALTLTCPPIEIKEVTFITQEADQQQSISITSKGLAHNNQTQLQIERLFDDYTRPTVSQRLKQMLRFYLSNKSLPFSVVA